MIHLKNMVYIITFLKKWVQLIKESLFMVYQYLEIGVVALIYLLYFHMHGQRQADDFKHITKNVFLFHFL